MNQAHYHLLFNHLPIIFPFVGMMVMIGGIIFRSEIVKRVAYAIFILGALFTIPAFATGEGAEETIENIEGIDKVIIHTHEEIAETFAILSYILGAISITGLWGNWKQQPFSGWMTYITISFCIIVLFFSQQTGTSGGEIRHPEIRQD